jgi:hypothetical protein
MRRRVTGALSRLGGAAVLVALTASQADAREYQFSMTFDWQGRNTVTLQILPPVAIANAQISGPNINVVGPAFMASTSQTCIFITRMPVFGNSQAAEGDCVTIDHDGHVVYSHFVCTGTRETCDGTITFTGGTGKFAGATGTGTTQGRTSAMEPNGPSTGRNLIQGTLILPD